MKTVKQLLDAKGHNVWTIAPNASVFEAIKLLDAKKIGALVVVKEDRPIGIISERDYARKVILKGRSSKETTIREIMTPKVFFALPHQSVERCMALMTENKIRHLPVLDRGILCGMISIGDLVKCIIAEQEFIIRQLEHYISH